MLRDQTDWNLFTLGDHIHGASEQFFIILVHSNVLVKAFFMHCVCFKSFSYPSRRCFEELLYNLVSYIKDLVSLFNMTEFVDPLSMCVESLN